MATEKRDYRKEMADRIIALMEKAEKWDQPWMPSGLKPHNPVTGTVYRGINMISLMSAGFEDGRFYTFKNIKDLSAKIEKEGGEPIRLKKGSVGTPIFKAVKINVGDKKEDGDTESGEVEPIKSFMVYAYAATVFNASQIDNLPAPEPEALNEAVAPAEKAEFAIRAMCEETGLSWEEIRSDRAFYDPGADKVTVPLRTQFKDISEFYSTALHELGHATGHPDRLNRNLAPKSDISSYAFEELVAELTSYFTSSETGVPYSGKTHRNHAAYMKEWISALRENKNVLFKACSQAAKASDYIARIANDHRDRAKMANHDVFGDQAIPEAFHTESEIEDPFDFSDVTAAADDAPPDDLDIMSAKDAYEEFGINIDTSFSRINSDEFHMGM